MVQDDGGAGQGSNVKRQKRGSPEDIMMRDIGLTSDDDDSDDAWGTSEDDDYEPDNEPDGPDGDAGPLGMSFILTSIMYLHCVSEQHCLARCSSCLHKLSTGHGLLRWTRQQFDSWHDCTRSRACCVISIEAEGAPGGLQIEGGPASRPRSSKWRPFTLGSCWLILERPLVSPSPQSYCRLGLHGVSRAHRLLC